MLEELLAKIEMENRQTMLDRVDTRQRLELIGQLSSEQRRTIRRRLGSPLIAIGAHLSSEALHERSAAIRSSSTQGRLAS